MSRATARRPVTVEGVGLHSGAPSAITIQPSPTPEGIRFRRSDLDPKVVIRADVDAVSGTDRCTRLGVGHYSIQTVEHFLSAVVGLEFDDLLVDVDGPELPAGDGSARIFVDALTKAGRRVSADPPGRFSLDAPLTVTHETANYVVTPSDVLEIDVTIEWSHPLIGRQRGRYVVTPSTYTSALADARTFGLVEDVKALQARGLALGASVETSIALTHEGMLDGELRWSDEFVRHKALDVLGDLALIGGRLAARVEAVRPSHAGNVALARAIRRAILEER